MGGELQKNNDLIYRDFNSTLRNMQKAVIWGEIGLTTLFLLGPIIQVDASVGEHHTSLYSLYKAKY